MERGTYRVSRRLEEKPLPLACGPNVESTHGLRHHETFQQPPAVAGITSHTCSFPKMVEA
jgi:hypothetical protein